MVVGLSVLVIVFAGFTFLFFSREKNTRYALETIENKNKSYEETLNRLVHDAVNPLSTTAMALHNLSFILKEQNIPAENQEAIYEFLHSALDAIEETNRRLKDTILFTRTDDRHFKPVNIKEIAESVVAELDPAISVIKTFDTQLPMLHSDPQVLRLVFSSLIELSFSKDPKQIIHFKLNRKQTKKNIMSCSIFNHNFLGAEPDSSFSSLESGNLNNSASSKLNIVQRLLSFHNSEIIGRFEKQNGGYWTFSLMGIKE